MTDTNHNGNMHPGNDSLTGLPTLKGWVSELAEGRFVSAGYILSLRFTDLEQINQMYGQAGGDILLTQVVTLLQGWLPKQKLLVRESRSDLFYLWMPGSSHDETQQLAHHLQQSLFASGVVITSGVEIHPHAVVTIYPVAEHDAVYGVIEELERMEVREPTLDAPQLSGEKSSLALLNATLENNRTFGLEPLVERIHACFNLKSMKRPQTILLLAPLQSVKSRTLGIVGNYLGSSNIPMANVSCHPSDRVVSCGLLAAILLALIPSYPPDLLRVRVFPLCDITPWLASLFPTLRQNEAAPLPPDDPELVRTTLLAVLQTMVQAHSAIIIINSLQFADTDSIMVLGALQQRDDHGLLLIGGVDTEGKSIPAVINPLVTSATNIITSKPFSGKMIGEYLDTVLRGIRTPALVKLLRERCGGWLLNIESMLRSWAESGVLNHDMGRWQLDTATIPAELFSTLSPRERIFLAQAALVGPIQIGFLTALWKLNSNSETQVIVEHAREMGFLLPMNPQNPQHVEFRDNEYATQLTELLTQEEVLQTHAEIASLLENTSITLDELHTEAEVAYHLSESGQTEHAMQHHEPLPKSLVDFINTIKEQQTGASSNERETSLPRDKPVEQTDLPLLIDAVLKIRLVGVACRIYPPNSEIVRSQMEDAIAAIDQMFITRSSIAVSTDGIQIALEGRIQDRRDMVTPMKDYLSWMNEAQLQTLGIMHGVTAEEIREMFVTIALYDNQRATDSLLHILQGLKLPHIRFVSHQQQMHQLYPGETETINVPAELTGTLLMNMANQTLAPVGAAIQPDQLQYPRSPMLPPQQQQEGNEMAPEPSPAFVAAGEHVVSSMGMSADPPTGYQDTAGKSRLTSQDLLDMSLATNNPATMTANEWSQLPHILAESSPQMRLSVLKNLNNWLAKSPNIVNEPVNLCLNNLLVDRLEQERDITVLRETARTAMARLQALMKCHDWNQVLTIVESVSLRIKDESDTTIQEQVADILDATTKTDEFHELVIDALSDVERLDELRRLVTSSGERTWPILMDALINSDIMQVRIHVMLLMKEFGNDVLPLLIHELRNPYPWYVYRNLLLAVSEVGSMEVMPAVAALFHHEDSRVRTVALNAAVRIGRDEACEYLLAGLNDENVEIRTQAVALAGLCLQRDVMERLIQMLQRGMFNKEEPENIQVVAALTLGQFPDKEARGCLMDLLSPRIFLRKSDNIRIAAINALATHLANRAVYEKLKHVAHDRNHAIQSAAHRVLQQFSAGGK